MQLDIQPNLKGELVSIRPLVEEDWDALFAIASDPLVWELHPNRDRYKEEVFREFFRVAMESRGAFVVIDSKTNKIIGSSRFKWNEHNGAKELEIGWTFLAREYWGGKYNGDLKRLMLRHAFEHTDKVKFFIGKDNLRSRRAIEKIGGELVGSQVEQDGLTTMIYAITPQTLIDAYE